MGTFDKLFVDYAGDTVPVIVDRLTGEIRDAQIFVAVMGASSFSYAHATWTQGLADWLACHIGALEAIGGSPKLLVPDNAKVAVIKACLYDPQVNQTYAEMGAHYDMAVLPAQPRKPGRPRQVSNTARRSGAQRGASRSRMVDHDGVADVVPSMVIIERASSRAFVTVIITAALYASASDPSASPNDTRTRVPSTIVT